MKQLEDWHAKGKHEKIAETLLALPEKERNYNLTSLLARALNNLSRYEEALHLLESVRAEGQDDAYWHFRMGYSLFYIDGREVEAIAYLERAIELGDDYPATYELLLNAKAYAREMQSSDTGNIEDVTEIETSFVPKAYATLSLNMRLQPQHRAIYIEDGLDFMFRSKGWGCVSGGGTLLSTEGEPESCDIEIDLVDDSEEMRQNLLSVAQKLEVAKGSKLKYRSAGKDSFEYDVEYSTGNLEGLAIYLNGTDLPDEVYEEYNIDEVVNELLNLLSNNGALNHSYWEGANETALYFYGEGDFYTMLEKVTPFLNEHPLCLKCRTVRI